MDILEARQVLAAELKAYRAKPYAELVQLRGGAIVSEQTGPSGAHYQLEVEVMWDDQSNGSIRVIGAVDDGGWRAFMPLTESFIKLPTGNFVGGIGIFCFKRHVQSMRRPNITCSRPPRSFTCTHERLL